MQLKVSALLLTASLILSGCGAKIPHNTPCTIHLPFSLATCSDGNISKDVTLPELDKYVCFDPIAVERVFNYVYSILDGKSKKGEKIPHNVPCTMNFPASVLDCSDGGAVTTKPISSSDKMVCWVKIEVERIFAFIAKQELDRDTSREPD